MLKRKSKLGKVGPQGFLQRILSLLGLLLLEPIIKSFWFKDSFGKSSRAIEAKRWIFWKLSINTQLYKFWHFNILSRIYIIQPANRYLLKLNRTGHKIQDDFVRMDKTVLALLFKLDLFRCICINQQNNKTSIFLLLNCQALD